MDIKTTIKRLKDYKKDKEEKQRLEKEMYEQECERYENIILSMSNEMDELLELRKIAKDCLDEKQFNFFITEYKSISFDKDSNEEFSVDINDKFLRIYKNRANGYNLRFGEDDPRLVLMKTFVKNFEKFKQEKIKYVNNVLDGKI